MPCTQKISQGTTDLSCNNVFVDLRKELLQESNYRNDENIKRLCKCPYIEVEIEGIQVKMLLDTGSEVTCISEEFANENEQILKKCPKLPITGKNVRVAIGKTTTKIKWQILCNLKIKNGIEDLIFLIVPGLATKCILGYDGQKDLKIALFPETDTILYKGDVMSVNMNHTCNQGDCVSHTIKLEDFSEVQKETYLLNLIENEENIIFEDDDDQVTMEKIREKIADNPTLQENQRQKLAELIFKYKDVFDKNPGLIKNYEYELRLKDNTPFLIKTYPVPLKYEDKVDKEIQKMLDLGIISRSNSNYINPVVIVVKKDGSIRLCLDCRQINSKLEDDKESPTGIEEIFHKCHGVVYMSSMDLTASFWQIKLAENSRKYMAFMIKGQIYHFNVVPFGCKNSTAALLRAFSLSSLKALLKFIDDVLCLTRTFKEHLRALEELFIFLLENNIKLNFDKSSFVQQELKFLGHILTKDGLKQDPKKTEAIQKLPRPRNLRELQSFLGFLNFYAKFIDRYAYVVFPLFELEKKGVKFKWLPKHEFAYQEIKRLFLKEMILAYPNVMKDYFLTTDASNYAISAILSQLDDFDEEKIVICISRTLKSAELNYFTTEKEMLAIVWALEKLRVYLLGAQIRVRTDHKCITFFNKCRFANSRLMRWILAIQDYNISYEHIPGKRNGAADCFSRNPNDFDATKIDDEMSIMGVFLVDPDKKLIKDLKNLSRLQKEDEHIGKIYDGVNSERYSKNYALINNILCKKGKFAEKIVLPEKLAKEMAVQLHEIYCHVGAKKIFKMLDEEFFVRNFRRKVHIWLKTCDICQRIKYHNVAAAPLQQITPEKPNDLLSIDYIGPLASAPLGFKYILVCTDAFSKYVVLYPLKKATTRITIEKIFNDYIPKYGKVKRIITDHGTQFTSSVWVNRLKREKIEPVFSSIRHPQSNIVERVNKELGRFFRALVGERHGSWVNYVDVIQKCINETHHETTELTPMELHFNEKPTRFWTKIFKDDFQKIPVNHEQQICLAREKIFLKRKKANERINARREIRNYNIGDLVLVKALRVSNQKENKIAKFFDIFEGPYKVKQKYGPTTYLLQDVDTDVERGKFHIDSLRTYHVS